MSEYRVRVVYDEHTQFEECNGELGPLTEEEYAKDYYMQDGQPIPYDEYLEYYGNPDRHVYVGVIVDKRCQCCRQWEENKASLWGIDFMDDSPEVDAVHLPECEFTVEQALRLPGYLGEVAKEVLHEAGYVEETVRHTSCRHCGQDIEGIAPFPLGEWRDRGNNRTCPTSKGDEGLRHAPLGYLEPDPRD